MKLIPTLTCLFYLLCFSTVAQGKFTINNSRGVESIPFTLVNNLVIIPLEINGEEMSFLLDTGITNTLLFNVELQDSTKLKNVKRVNVRGLGEGHDLQAYKSNNNVIKVRDIVGSGQSLHIIKDKQFDLSAKMGVNVHGIIGNAFFKDFIVRINYSTKRVVVYEPDQFDYNKCKNCKEFPLEFRKNKPYINIVVSNSLDELFEVKLLIDSGAGDAIWLFKNTHDQILEPTNYFDDFLGKGLSGNVYGKRSVIDQVKIGDFEFKEVVAAYPDSTSIITIHDNKNRNGTLGAEILKRFHVIFDYPNKKITLKKNNVFYKAPFEYNKSGIEVVYDGEELIREKVSRFVDYEIKENQNSAVTEVMATYHLAFKPSYSISQIRHGSPAHMAGLMVGDRLVEINSQPAYKKKLSEIIKILSGKANKRIRLTIKRNDKKLKYEFTLKDML